MSAEPDIEIVGQAADGQQAVELARRLKPDIVLMDIRMPQLVVLGHESNLDPTNPQPQVELTDPAKHPSRQEGPAPGGKRSGGECDARDVTSAAAALSIRA